MQYFYKSNKCKADQGGDSDCICWYDEGSGPLPVAISRDIYSPLGWRETPDSSEQLLKYEKALRDIKKHLELSSDDLARHSTVYRIACMALVK